MSFDQLRLSGDTPLPELLLAGLAGRQPAPAVAVAAAVAAPPSERRSASIDRASSTRSRRLSFASRDGEAAAAALREEYSRAYDEAQRRSQSREEGEQEAAAVRRRQQQQQEQQQQQQQQQRQQQQQQWGGWHQDGADGGQCRAVGVSAACLSRAGREPSFRKANQDAMLAFERYCANAGGGMGGACITADGGGGSGSADGSGGSATVGDAALFAAMDGHGPQGALVSAFVKHHLPTLLAERLAAGLAAHEALAEGFLEVDARLEASAIDVDFSGSTCVVSYLAGNELTTAWVGDSRCVLGRVDGAGGWQAVDLTADHKPDRPEEHARIVAAQGRVER